MERNMTNPLDLIDAQSIYLAYDKQNSDDHLIHGFKLGNLTQFQYLIKQ